LLLDHRIRLTPGKGRVVKTGSLGDVMQRVYPDGDLNRLCAVALKRWVCDDFHEKTRFARACARKGATQKMAPALVSVMCTAHWCRR